MTTSVPSISNSTVMTLSTATPSWSACLGAVVAGGMVGTAVTQDNIQVSVAMAVGAIIEPDQAEDIITNGRADLIAIGRELLADTQWVYKAATKFGLSNSKDFLPDSYSFFLSRRDDYLDRSAKPA